MLHWCQALRDLFARYGETRNHYGISSMVLINFRVFVYCPRGENWNLLQVWEVCPETQ